MGPPLVCQDAKACMEAHTPLCPEGVIRREGGERAQRWFCGNTATARPPFLALGHPGAGLTPHPFPSFLAVRIHSLAEINLLGRDFVVAANSSFLEVALELDCAGAW